MSLSKTDQAILLLTAHFSGAKGASVSPLTPTEYGRFSRWLLDSGFRPDDLFDRYDSVIESWLDPKSKIPPQRLKDLLGRGAAMGIALDKWSNAGIWVMTRADAGYPQRLKNKLRSDAPPVLFGVGNQKLLDSGGIAIVGSRSIDSEDESYARSIAESGAREGKNVVSGGAKGVDSTAMKAALAVNGTAVGVLSNGLFAAALASEWRPKLRSTDLCLISPFNPEARFHVGMAMARNKYIYCLADYAVVVRSDKGKGGTWAGAIEAIKKKLAPVYVRSDSNAPGNAALMESGAKPLNRPKVVKGAWLVAALNPPALKEKLSPADSTTVSEPYAATYSPNEVGTDLATGSDREGNPAQLAQPAELPQTSFSTPEEELRSNGKDVFYSHFRNCLLETLQQHSEVTLKELKQRHADLVPSQLSSWLTRVVEEGVVVKVGKKQLYTLPECEAKQQSLL